MDLYVNMTLIARMIAYSVVHLPPSTDKLKAEAEALEEEKGKKQVG